METQISLIESDFSFEIEPSNLGSDKKPSKIN
jgi:hypothetical protein